jgi:hypothetical protein
MNYPRDIKAFYMRVNDDGRTGRGDGRAGTGIGEIVQVGGIGIDCCVTE